MKRRTVLFALVTVPICACVRAGGPEEPAWGKQPCAHCAMLLDDRRTAAQVVTEKGERLFFDDLGCMVMWEGKAKQRWVRGPGAEGWIDANSAKYARAEHTPMDYGWVASREGVSFAELQKLVRQPAGEKP